VEITSIEQANSVRNSDCALPAHSVNEPFFEDLSYSDLRMPQMLIVEAMAQASALLCSLSFVHQVDLIYIFAGIDHCRFGRSVVPGDQLLLEVAAIRMARKYGKYHARALVNGELAAEADLVAVVAWYCEAIAR
jgi:3-hydroxyacyl-[acyl-carrier-protein] dehydratase